MPVIELLKPTVIRGRKRLKGEKITVSKWVAQAMLGSNPPRAIKPGTPTHVKSKKVAPRLGYRISMERLLEMRKAEEFKAARQIMRAHYGIKAAGWDDLLEKAALVVPKTDAG